MKIRILNTDNVPDAAGHTFDGAVVQFEPNVPVYLEHDKRVLLGNAKLALVEGGVDAEIEWLGLPEYGYPSVDIRVFVVEGNNIKACDIEAVAIVRGPNSDSRIQAITADME